MNSWAITMEQNRYHRDDMIRAAADTKLAREARRAAKARRTGAKPTATRRRTFRLRAPQLSA